MNISKPILPGVPVLPQTGTPQAPPAPPKAAEPAAPAPVEIDLGALLADQKQIDPSKGTGASFDVKTLNFEQMASRTLEKVAQVRRLSDEGSQAVMLRIGSNRVEIPSNMLNKEGLIKLLTDTLAKLSPADLQSALDLAQRAQPLVAQIRGETPDKAVTQAGPPADNKAPDSTAPASRPETQAATEEPKAPESLDELFKGNFADEKTFNKYAKGFLEGKLGAKSIDAGFVASYLHDALYGDNIGKQVRGLGYVVVRLHEMSQRDPKVKEALNRLISQVEGNVPPALQPVFKKMFTQKGPSLGHINNLYIVSQGKLSPPIEAAKTFYAAFELMHYFSSDVKAFLPPQSQRMIDRLEALCGKEMGNSVGKLFRKFMPMGMASDFSIALCKIVASDNQVARMAGVMDLVKLTGLRLFGDGGHFASLMSFAKIDIDTTVYMKQLLEPSSPPELKAKALKNIVEIYQTRLDKFAAAFPPGTIPASVAADAEKLLALVPKDAVGIAEKLAHYGLDKPEALAAAMGKLEDFGIENQDQLLTFLQKMGNGNPHESIQAVHGLKEKGITSLQQLGEAMQKLGVKDAAGLEKAFAGLSKYGISTFEDAAGLLQKLGAKNAEQGMEALTALGLKPGKISLEALQQTVEKALFELAPHGVSDASELLDLMKRTGAKNLEDVLAKLEKTGVSIGTEGAELLSRLGVQNSAQITELLTLIGSKTSAEATALIDKFKAFGLKGDEVMKLMDGLGLKGSKDAEKALSLLKTLGVQAGDNAEKTLAGIKSLGVRYIDRFASDWQKLAPFGIHNLDDAADAAKLLGIKNIDQMEEGIARLSKAGIPNLQAADTLFRNLAGVKNLDDALIALDKLRKLGAKTPEQAIELMKTLAMSKISTVDQAVELFSKLGIKSFEELDKLMPELEKLSQMGINSGPELISFVGDMGGRNLKQAVKTLESLEKLGFKDGGKAIAIAKRLGLEKTGWLASTMEKLGLQGGKVERMVARLESIGVKSLEEAVELLDKTGLKNADELLDLFKKFDIYDSKTLKEMMGKLGCGDDLGKLGATLSKMKDLAIDHIDDAIAFARKMGMESVSDAAALMGRFAKAGINHPEEVFKLLEKLGVDISKAKPAELLTHMEKALALTEEAAKYGVKGIDDVAETIGKTGAKTAAELGEKMVARAGKVNVLTKALGLSDEAAGAMVKLVQNGHMSEEVLEKAMNVLKALGREKADTIARVLVHMQPDIVAALFKSETLAKGVLSGVAEMVPKLVKLGIGAAEIGAKLGKGILKVLPAAGIAMSGADMIRTKTIAITGEWTEIGLKGFGKKISYNADARGLAAIAGAANTVDTAMAVVEWALPALGPVITALPNVGLALTEVALDVMMDYYNEHPMPATMKNVVEVSAYAIATAQFDVVTLVALNRSYGKAAEHSGQAIAQLLQDKTKKPADIEKFIVELSKSWTRNDDATRAMFKALEDQGVSLDSLMKQNPPRLTQKSLQLLFDNLNSTMTFDAGAADYKRMDTIGKVASVDVRAHMVTALMDQQTNTQEETLIHNLLSRASDTDLKAILHKVDVAKLAGELEDPKQYQQVLQRVIKLDDDSLLDTFLKSKDLSQDKATAAAHTLIDAGVPLSEKQRAMLFDRLSQGGDARLLQTLLLGNTDSGGKFRPIQDKALLNKMVGQAAGRIKEFISITRNDPRQAAALAVMVLLHGNQQQIDQAFGGIRGGQWFGNGSDIVRTAISEAKAQQIDLKGKLSHQTLNAMLGSLDNGWTKAFRMVGGSEHAKAEELLLDLARMTDATGKAAIIKDMMEGWTPGSYESKIATILRETTDPKAFTELVNQLDLKTLSGELENRSELGGVMATILERYQGDKNQALRTIMSAWSNASIQSDDILHHMVKTLEKDKHLDALRQLPNSTLDEMIDWTDDSFRDGRVIGLDAESHWTINLLEAAKTQAGH